MCRLVILDLPIESFFDDLCALIPGGLLIPYSLADHLHAVGVGRLSQSVDLLADEQVDQLHGLRLQLPLLGQLCVQLCVLLLLRLLIPREVPMHALDSLGKGMHGGGRDWLDQKVARPAVKLGQRCLIGAQGILLVPTRRLFGLRRGD